MSLLLVVYCDGGMILEGFLILIEVRVIIEKIKREIEDNMVIVWCVLSD